MSGEWQKINVAPFVQYLIEVLPCLLGGSKDELAKQLADIDTVKLLKEFIGDEQDAVLLVTRELFEEEAKADGKADIKEGIGKEYTIFFNLMDTFTLMNRNANVVALVKRSLTTFRAVYEGKMADKNGSGGKEEESKPKGPWQSQLAMITLATTDTSLSFYDLVDTYVNKVFSPVVNVYRQDSGKAQNTYSDHDEVGGDATQVQRKIAELSMALKQCQQNSEIEEIVLVTNPEVQQAAIRCHNEETPFTAEVFKDRLDDAAFLNQLQTGVNKWVKEIQRVCKISRDPTTGSATQEINFWLGMEKALIDVRNQLQTPEVQVSLELLKGARKFLATVSFESDTGLKPAQEKVQNYLTLLRELPINDLIGATTIDQATQALRVIFRYMQKIKNASQYPLWRASNLVEALSRDLSAQLLRILHGQRIMQQELEAYEQTMYNCTELFRVWDDEVRQFKELVRDQIKKRGTNERPPVRITVEHAQIQERISDLQKFRRQHMKLQEVIERVLEEGKDGSAKESVKAAYRVIEGIDVLDVSKRGQQEWEAAKKRYEELIDHAEGEITARLRDRLGGAQTASEMFRVFHRFNALFVRPRIRSAIQEYQSLLIEQVKGDVKRLQDKYKDRYETTQAAKMAAVRDIPPTAGLVIWAKQLERRLHLYMGRMEDVLGRGWEQHVDGQKLKADGDALAKKMNSQATFEAWLRNLKDAKQIDLNMRIFDVQQSYQHLALLVNFDENIITLFKEVRNLQAMQFRVPYVIKVTSDEAKQNYPLAMVLREAVRSYMQTCSQITPATAPLIVSFQSGVQQLISEGCPLKWDSDRLEPYTKKLSDQVFLFQQKFTELASHTEVMDAAIDTIDNIDVQGDANSRTLLEETFEKMQKIIDDMNIANYSNLDGWVQQLQKRIEQRLTRALTKLVDEWIRQFSAWPSNGTSLIQEYSVHELLIVNQRLSLRPQKEFATTKWIKHFHRTLGIVCNLPHLRADRYNNTTQKGTNGDTRFTGLLLQVEERMLQDAYRTIYETIGRMEEYVAGWLQYQSLWEISSPQVLRQVGDDIESWLKMLNEIRETSASLETSEHEKRFGPIFVDFGQVQLKVKSKYDQWRNDLVGEFAEKVRDRQTEFHRRLVQSRESLEAADPNELSKMCMVVLGIKGKASKWDKEYQDLCTANKLLVRQRYQFPKDWQPIEMVEGEWGAFTQILDRRSRVMERELPKLKSLLMQREKQTEENITTLYAEWASQKPVQGSMKPSTAMEVLTAFQQRLTSVTEEYDQLGTVKASMNMEVGNPEALVPLSDEIDGLRLVWSEINSVYSKLEELKETPWTAVVAKKVKGSLDDLTASLDAMPTKLKQYEAWEHTQGAINKFIKINALIADLKGGALKDRHWKIILQDLRITVPFNQLTLGGLWDADLQKNETAVKDVLIRAQGEMGLEEFLREVREYWSAFQLDLVPYKSKTRLIKGFDDLFTNIDEHLNSLASMKLSPYYKSFEEEALVWDDRLNKMRQLFDIWMDVQRRWVYLEGIFNASADIQTLLPNEAARFKQIDSEYIGLMKKTTAKPKVIDVIGFGDVVKQLQKMADNLTLVQKALGDYLERQRSNFARFYFVGDEDLLEMIGSSRDVKTVSRHLAKMFAGLSELVCEKDSLDLLEFMTSREGETVKFTKTINISDDPSINGWLSKVETTMQTSLGDHLNNAMTEMEQVFAEGQIVEKAFLTWVDTYPCQVLLIAVLVEWCGKVEAAFTRGGTKALEEIVPNIVSKTVFMAEQVLKDIKKDTRQKIAQMITEVVHHRDVSRQMVKDGIASKTNFVWLQLMRMYFNPKEPNILQKLTIVMADASFFYGFEYVGIADKLVQTPLNDRCFLTLTQALHMRLGANPFGPAGTGKTESVKALGNTMGRFVLVFCCDDGFDFNAMGRIFIGLCQVGAWGCFDEFNRLEERILSAVSEQVLTIQTGNKQNKKEIEILGKKVRLNSNVGIFVTMNPDYAGRSNLPDNLKQLFRAMAMTKPDKALIAQVNLFSQGFASAERIAGKIVFLFDLCGDQLSSQPHYDFGLRSLKAVLACAGQLKRDTVARIGLEKVRAMSAEEVAEAEERVVLRSIYDTLVPKLVAQDKPLMECLIEGTFPGCSIGATEQQVLQDEIRRLCKLRHLECTDNFMLKCMELYAIQNITHGIMLVGAVGTGKSKVWKTLLDAMEKVDGVKGEVYVVDPKAISKEELYGKLDSTTLEWTDGVFTESLRRVSAGLRGEKDRRQWLMFDGDVDPEWAENLNSVLDDSKLLTLPNGERLAIPPNVRIMFEVDTLKYATLATVSRCGMVWFADDVVYPEMISSHELLWIKYGNLEKERKGGGMEKLDEPPATAEEKVKHKCVEILAPHFKKDELVMQVLAKCETMDHIMVFTHIRALTSLFSLVRKGIGMISEYNESHEEFPLADDNMDKFLTKWLLLGICWAFGGDMHLNLRMEFCVALADVCPSSIGLPSGLDGDTTLLDFEPRVEDGEWHHWNERVPTLDIDPDRVGDGSLIIATVDTVRHVAALVAWLEERRPFILSGPPGSGKTMTLMSTMKSMGNQLELASLNFSAGTTPELLLQTFELYCEYVKTPNGVLMRPKEQGKWVVVFCDECNLPAADKYSTQKVIMFIRQITEYGGFYRPLDNAWVNVERVQFLGACNPPTDPGRHPMSDRFLRHAPVIWVDYPGPDSLKQIYGTFNRGMMKLQPHIPQDRADKMTNVMVQFWRDNSKQFTSDMQPHYLYSPRELTRWKVALHETMQHMEGMTEETLIRLLMHEALRIFVDRIVFPEEKEWAEGKLDAAVKEEFGCDDSVMARPILFSCYLNPEAKYVDVGRDELRAFVEAKLKIFYEEVLAVKLVIFDEVLDHIVRMDRVLRQPLGHLLLVGASGAGKTVLSKFVSWMNGLSIYALKIGKGYDVVSFENDLRMVMKRSGCKKEKITFIFDESNALGPAFLERMNALLASGEVPGLFEGDEYVNLMSECRSSGMSGMEENEMFVKFTKQVQRNLHIVFTMNPANPDFYNRSNSSPALFNRCIIDWFGDWPHSALLQVAREFTGQIALKQDSYTDPKFADEASRHECLAETIVAFHERVDETNVVLRKSAMKYNFITPRDFLDFINHFLEILEEKKEEVLEQQKHISGGLLKLRETEEQVHSMQSGLAVYEKELVQKNKNAEETMTQMVTGQTEAEESKKNSLKLSDALALQSEEIEVERKKINDEIAGVEPAVQEAKNAVRNVDKKSIDELRVLKTPPAAIQLAMEAVVIMVKPESEKSISWDLCKKLMKDSSFIPSILEFDPEQMKEATRKAVETKYLASKGWDLTAINRASKAAGPVALWVQSQIKFVKLMNELEPLTNRLREMENKQNSNKQELEHQQQTIKDMEHKIVKYRENYAQLIAEVSKIKAEKESVQEKCERSAKLLSGLESEKIRWEATSRGFTEQENSLVGDVLLSGAFCTFTGFFDLFMRNAINRDWKEIIGEASIKYKQDITMTDYLAKASQLLHWKENALPDDSLCQENAIILKRFLRYPMIIDPAGQAITFLKNLYKEKRLLVTSFTESSFMKNLETSLRFGAPLLVMDVDRVDPILNNVLNRETFKQGMRILISLGDQDIDFSPAFEMFMCTRDSTLQFTPDLCSRVTFVNFTVTPSSLQSQCMNALLKSERPDVDQKRSDLMKLQGEFKVKMRQLEDDLLHALSSVQGSILEDLKVIATLEKIKNDSKEIEKQVAATDATMVEILETMTMYETPGNIAANIFFLLESMGPLNTFYKFSLSFFFQVFTGAFKTECQEIKDCSGDHQKRLGVIIQVLFKDAFAKVASGLQEADVMVYGLRLAQILAEQESPLNSEVLDLLLKGASTDIFKTDKAHLAEKCKTVLMGKLSESQQKSLQDLHTLPHFAGLADNIQSKESEWLAFLAHLEPETVFPQGWADPMLSGSEANSVLQQTLILKALRPDRVVISCVKLVETILGARFLELPAFDLHKILDTDSKATSPLMFVSAPGFDASNKVIELAQATNKTLMSAAMGSEDGFKVADKSIASALKSGQWVLLKNVHLAVKWLTELEKKLYGANPSPTFRLFLTMEFSPKIPPNLIRLSRVYVFEPPSGIKASLQRSFAQLFPEEITSRAPVERCRLHFLLAFLHAVILERLRFYPVGWSKKYQFSDADQKCARDVIDNWVDNASSNGQLSNISPDKVPWDAIRSVLGESVYGGRIDNEFDHMMLKAFIDHLFCEASFNSNFSLNKTVGKDGALLSPDARKREQFVEWIEALPAKGSPQWVGLPVHAEQMLRINRANHSLQLWLKMQGSVVSAPKAAKSQGRRASIKNPLADTEKKVDIFLSNLPESLPRLERTDDSLKDPLWRCFDREMGFGRSLLARIRADLLLLKGVCAGEIKLTNDLRALLSDMQMDSIPGHWRTFACADMTVTDWISDFIRRCSQLQEIDSNSHAFQKIVLWFGGLFFPEAFLTASRQAVAQNLKCSLEELVLVADIGETAVDQQCFLVKGLYMDGAAWDQKGKCLATTDDLTVAMPNSRLKWVRRDSNEYKITLEYLHLPVYLNMERKVVVCPFKLKAPDSMPTALWLQRSVCLTLWTKI